MENVDANKNLTNAMQYGYLIEDDAAAYISLGLL